MRLPDPIPLKIHSPISHSRLRVHGLVALATVSRPAPLSAPPIDLL